MSLSLENATGLNSVFAVASAGAALSGITGAATTFSTALFGYTINGVPYNKAVQAGAASPTTDANTGNALTLVAGQAKLIVWVVKTDGTMGVVAGVAGSNASGTPLQYPPIPSGWVPFAVHTLVAGSTLVGTWSFGSSNWNATGLTVGAITNLAGQLPGSGQTVA